MHSNFIFYDLNDLIVVGSREWKDECTKKINDDAYAEVMIP